MKTEPTIFSFEASSQIRMVIIDEHPYFVAQDVCKALAIQAVDVALRKLDADEKGTYSIRTHGGYQSQSVISESGLYTLILRCRDAVTPGTIPYRFRKWVTSEVLPAIRQTGSYSMRQPETLGDLTGTATTMTVRDARRGKKETDKRAAERIAEVCVPVIMKEMRDYQYHYSNCNVGPDEVIPALLSDNRKGLQLRALLGELANNNHDVSGAWRELEAIRLYLVEQRKLLNDIASHSGYISQLIER